MTEYNFNGPYDSENDPADNGSIDQTVSDYDNYGEDHTYDNSGDYGDNSNDDSDDDSDNDSDN